MLSIIINILIDQFLHKDTISGFKERNIKIDTTQFSELEKKQLPEIIKNDNEQHKRFKIDNNQFSELEKKRQRTT